MHVYRLVTAGTVKRMAARGEEAVPGADGVWEAKQSESLEGVDKRDLYGLLRFGVDAIFANDEQAPTATSWRF